MKSTLISYSWIHEDALLPIHVLRKVDSRIDIAVNENYKIDLLPKDYFIKVAFITKPIALMTTNRV